MRGTLASKSLAPVAAPRERGRARTDAKSPRSLLGGLGLRNGPSKGDVTFLFRNLATLVQNGVSLPKALATLAEERALEHCREILLALHKSLEAGSSFSGALAAFPQAFDIICVNQVKVGERAGTLADTLAQVAEQRAKAGKLRAEVLKKLAYPGLLVVVGGCVIAFLLTYVIPVFQETYESAHVALPMITRVMIGLGAAARGYGLFALLGVALGAIGLAQLRKNARFAYEMDARLLRLPVVGSWLRDLAILELMEVLGNLMEAGYTLSDSLAEASGSVSNRAVKGCVNDLGRAVQRGERFSREVERHAELFPPLVSQLVIIGERTGNLARATRHIREHLREEVERKSSLAVGIIEPVLTISLAAAVGCILMAIYLPMFDMINTVGH